MTPNVFVTVNSLDPDTGGPARSVPSLGKAIHDVGADVQLYVNNKEGEAHGCKSSSTSLPVYPINKLGKTIQRLDEEKKNNALIHNHGIWLPPNHYASATAKRFNIPLIISPRGMLEPWARSYRSWKKTIAWHLYQRRDLKAATVLHATSIQEAKNFQSLALQTPIAVIPNGIIIPSQYRPKTFSRKTKKALFLSRIHPIKGLINLIQAWAKALPKGWEVMIVGPDESNHQQDVEKEVNRLGLEKTFSFLGPVSDIEKWPLYNKADLFILPTFSENFGIVVGEALASGVPVITTKGTPWAELTQHGCGWWIDIGVDPLAKALVEATSLSDEVRHSMGQRGRSLIAEKYSWETIAQDMISVYDWILHGGPLPRCVITD